MDFDDEDEDVDDADDDFLKPPLPKNMHAE